MPAPGLYFGARPVNSALDSLAYPSTDAVKCAHVLKNDYVSFHDISDAVHYLGGWLAVVCHKYYI